MAPAPTSAGHGATGAKPPAKKGCCLARLFRRAPPPPTACEARIEALRRSLENLRHEVQKSADGAAAQQHLLVRSQETLASSTAQLSAADATRREVEADVSSLRKTIADARNHSEGVAAVLDPLHMQLRSLKADVKVEEDAAADEERSRREAEEEALAPMKAECAELKAKLDEQEGMNGCLRKDVQAMQQSSDALLELHSRQTCSIEAVSSQNTRLEKELKQACSEVRQLEAHYWDGVPYRAALCVDTNEVERLRSRARKNDLELAELELEVANARRSAELAASEASAAAGSLMAVSTGVRTESAYSSSPSPRRRGLSPARVRLLPSLMEAAELDGISGPHGASVAKGLYGPGSCCEGPLNTPRGFTDVALSEPSTPKLAPTHKGHPAVVLGEVEALNSQLRSEIEAMREQLEQSKLRQQITSLRDVERQRAAADEEVALAKEQNDLKQEIATLRSRGSEKGLGVKQTDQTNEQAHLRQEIARLRSNQQERATRAAAKKEQEKQDHLRQEISLLRGRQGDVTDRAQFTDAGSNVHSFKQPIEPVAASFNNWNMPTPQSRTAGSLQSGQVHAPQVPLHSGQQRSMIRVPIINVSSWIPQNEQRAY